MSFVSELRREVDHVLIGTHERIQVFSLRTKILCFVFKERANAVNLGCWHKCRFECHHFAKIVLVDGTIFQVNMTECEKGLSNKTASGIHC